MNRIASQILAAIGGGIIGTIAVVSWLGWGIPRRGQSAYIDPSRADIVDLLLTILTIFLGAIGLTITLGALVVGVVAFKTLREIKLDAAKAAKDAAASMIKDTLPTTLRDMARGGDLDSPLEQAAMRMQTGGPEIDTEYENADDRDDHI